MLLLMSPILVRVRVILVFYFTKENPVIASVVFWRVALPGDQEPSDARPRDSHPLTGAKWFTGKGVQQNFFVGSTQFDPSER